MYPPLGIRRVVEPGVMFGTRGVGGRRTVGRRRVPRGGLPRGQRREVTLRDGDQPRHTWHIHKHNH